MQMSIGTRDPLGPTPRPVGLRALSIVLLTTVMIGSAHPAEGQTASEETSEQTAEAPKSPGGAFALSLMIPGAGQAHNGQWAKGALMLGGGLVSVGVALAGADQCDSSDDCSLLTAGLVGMVGFWVWSMVDAPVTANLINRRIDAGQVALEIGPQLTAPNRGSSVGLSLVRVRF